MSTDPVMSLGGLRAHVPKQSDRRTRVAGGLLTAILYGALTLVALWSFNHVPLPLRPTKEITAMLRLPEKKRDVEPPVLVRLIAPRAQMAAPPVITIAPPIPQGIPSGNGQMGQGAGAGSGAGGKGGGAGGCLDAVWMRAVSERVRQFFTYPPAALAVRKTGLVMVHFGVRRDGRIESLRISKSSGDAGLDKAALDIMQKAQPLPPIPDRMQTERVEGELPINFGVRGFNGSSTSGTCQ